MQFLYHFLQSYGWQNFHEFLLSLFPSFKYDMARITIPLSAIAAVVSEFLGISPLIILVMFIAVNVEVFTGIRASKKQGIRFESYRFSRCVIKVFIWVALFFMFNAFSIEMSGRSSNWLYLLGMYVFQTFHVTTMIFFVIEYSTSILENLAVIDGKPKDELVNSFKDMFKHFMKKTKDNDPK